MSFDAIKMHKKKNSDYRHEKKSKEPCVFDNIF